MKRVVRRALLEVLSRLNGATEGNLESITPVSLALLLLPSSVRLALANSSPLSRPPTSFIPCPPSYLCPSLTWEVISGQSANQLNARLLAEPRNCDLLPANVTDNGRKAPLLSTQWAPMTVRRPPSLLHTHMHGLSHTHTHCKGMIMHTHSSV